MTKVAETSHTMIAAQALLAELRDLTAEIRFIEDRLNKARARRVQVLQAFEASQIVLSDVEKELLDIRVAENSLVRPTLQRISQPARILIERLKSDLDKTWRVEELQGYLSKQGEAVSEEYASNTLRKLYEQGLLHRVGRGQYRVNNTILNIEGMDDRDLD